jgi:hypothetical protein
MAVVYSSKYRVEGADCFRSYIVYGTAPEQSQGDR